MFFPYKIETMLRRWPFANWVIIILTAVVFFMEGSMWEETFRAMVLDGWAPAGLFGHMLLHRDLVHLGGNLVFLWVFGNAVCGNTSNFAYPVLYLGFGLAAAAAQNILGGGLAIGASGAINGVVGMALVMYPVNRVGVFWFFIFRAGTLRIPLWVLASIWTAFDFLGALNGGDHVAHWAHLGGLAAGLAAGLIGLKKGGVKLFDYDHPTLLELMGWGTIARE